MHREVTVTELEPHVAANRAKALHAMPSLVGPAPAAFGIAQAPKRIKDGVDVGRDVQSEVIEVISGIHDHRYAGAKSPLQPERQFGAADTATQSNDFGTATHRKRSLARSRIKTEAGRAGALKSRPFTSTAGRPSAAWPITSEAPA